MKEETMYYLLNYAFTMFMAITIALVYNKSAPSGVIVALLVIGMSFELIASVYAESKYNDLKDRIKKLENRKDEK